MTAPPGGGGRVDDLVIIGGGVMGLFTAYHASGLSASVTVLERGRIGDPATASFGRTRSYRNDYLDPLYARLAIEATRLWRAFEGDTDSRALVGCGLLNIASTAVTPDLAQTYTQRSADVLTGMGVAPETLDRQQLATRYPYLRADIGHLHRNAGLVDLRSVTQALIRMLTARGVQMVEDVVVEAVSTRHDGVVEIDTPGRSYLARALVVTAGHGTNQVLNLLPGTPLQVPISKDRPREAKYFTPPPEQRARYLSDAMPVVAYLDCGVYLHPIVDGVIDHIKIGFFDPPDIPRGTTAITSVDDFVAACLPDLRSAAAAPVTDVDQCDYDMVADDDFVLGPVPGQDHVFVGVGWRGTGYKFAPLIGRMLSELALQHGTVYDVRRFDPARFSNHTPR